MRIAVLGAKGIPHPGGIEYVMEEVCARLAARGHRVAIYVRRHYMDGNTHRQYRGVDLPRSWGVHTKHWDALSHSCSALWSILAADFDLVYINSVGLSVLSFIPRLFGKKVVVQTHGLDWKREKWGALAKGLLRLSAYATVYFPNRTFCVCLEDKRFLERTFQKACAYVPNGVTVPELRTPDLIGEQFGLKEQGYVLFMARLVPEKGGHYLVQAWKRIPERVRQGRVLVLAGDTNHRGKYYYDLLAQQGNGILFTGFVTGAVKQELLSNAYCFVQPSTIEGMPISILEALSYGRFVLASDIPENRDVLQHCGGTFRSADVGELADKLSDILSDPARVEEEQERAVQFVHENYDWDRVVDVVEEELSNLVHR